LWVAARNCCAAAMSQNFKKIQQLFIYLGGQKKLVGKSRKNDSLQLQKRAAAPGPHV
jgi:hypothetical protein